MNYSIASKAKSSFKNQLYFIDQATDILKIGLSESKVKFTQQKLDESKSNRHYFIDEKGATIIVVNKNGAEDNRKNGHECFNIANGLKLNEIAIHNLGNEQACVDVLEGFLLSTYTFDKYKEKKSESKFDFEVVKGVQKETIALLDTIVRSTFIARDLVNEPHSYLNATNYSKEIKRIAAETGFKVEVFEKKKIEALKMGGLLGVNKGSVQPPTFNILEWKPKNAVNKQPYVLVGKGVVYDTGGLSLKPTANSMDFMKSDMAGSAAVVGTLAAISELNLPVYVVGLIPATDNRPGLDAIVPGDVLTMYSGKTVEVLNTDAEGRLILADALTYASKYKPQLVIDLATLTGAAAAAIGPLGIVCMGTADETVKDALKESGNTVHERLAEFPFWEEYGEMLKSDVADIKNLGGPYAGAITAGKFLEHFVDYPWMHFDIAGPSFSKAPDFYRGKNGTGVGVRLLINFFTKMAKV